MLTYVINTSENKVFDSDRLFEDELFDLAGYNKIRWMNCRLNELEQCAKEICERQCHLIADDFRIAVLVDFFGFDRIRSPYGYRGYGMEEEGVELSLYLPYIEAYVTDHLMGYLCRMEIYAHDYEVYYIRGGQYDRSYFLSNGKEQLRKILAGKEGTEEDVTDDKLRNAVWSLKTAKEEEAAEERRRKESEYRAFSDYTEKIARDFEKTEAESEADKDTDDPHGWVTPDEYEKVKEEIKPYSVFSLYCTPDVSLEFGVNDYPYGAGTSLSFDEFYDAFRDRVGRKTFIKRHHYIVSQNTSPARAAFDVLSLSLYLIKMYEREEISSENEEFEIEHIMPEALIRLLERSWNKINMAQKAARENRVRFYALEAISDSLAEKKPEDASDKIIGKYYAELEKENRGSGGSIEDHLAEIRKYAGHKKAGMDEIDRAEFNKIMLDYLKKRDETKEESVAEEFETMKHTGRLAMTDMYPAKTTYDRIVAEKNKEISDIMDRALNAEYVSVDYSPEEKRAEEAYGEYEAAKAKMSKNIIGDVLMLLFTLLAMLIPYRFLQPESFALDTLLRYLVAIGIFTALFVFSFVLHILPLARIMKNARLEAEHLRRSCEAKNKYSFHQIRRRYMQDLGEIEEKRYQLRQLEQLNRENIALNEQANAHRAMLKKIENRLSGILNNLGVEPRRNPDEYVEGEFDITKDIRSPENKIYRVLSLEAIEDLFQSGRR